MTNRAIGFYPVVLNFATPHASVGFWDGNEFSFPATPDTFTEGETLWVGPELKVEDLFPLEVRCKYRFYGEAQRFGESELIYETN